MPWITPRHACFVTKFPFSFQSGNENLVAVPTYEDRYGNVIIIKPGETKDSTPTYPDGETPPPGTKYEIKK